MLWRSVRLCEPLVHLWIKAVHAASKTCHKACFCPTHLGLSDVFARPDHCAACACRLGLQLPVKVCQPDSWGPKSTTRFVSVMCCFGRAHRLRRCSCPRSVPSKLWRPSWQAPRAAWLALRRPLKQTRPVGGRSLKELSTRCVHGCVFLPVPC